MTTYRAHLVRLVDTATGEPPVFEGPEAETLGERMAAMVRVPELAGDDVVLGPVPLTFSFLLFFLFGLGEGGPTTDWAQLEAAGGIPCLAHSTGPRLEDLVVVPDPIVPHPLTAQLLAALIGGGAVEPIEWGPMYAGLIIEEAATRVLFGFGDAFEFGYAQDPSGPRDGETWPPGPYSDTDGATDVFAFFHAVDTGFDAPIEGGTTLPPGPYDEGGAGFEWAQLHGTSETPGTIVGNGLAQPPTDFTPTDLTELEAALPPGFYWTYVGQALETHQPPGGTPGQATWWQLVAYRGEGPVEDPATWLLWNEQLGEWVDIVDAITGEPGPAPNWHRIVVAPGTVGPYDGP